MLSALHPLPKLIVCLVWLAASIAVFDPRFQAGIIALAALTLIFIERRSPLLVLALMVPFALFGFGFLTTATLFREESDFATRMAAETPFGSPAFSAGIVLFLRAIACGMVSAVFVLTTEPGRFIKALMANWRLSPRIGYALFSALHLVPDLASEAQQIRLARAMKKGRAPRRIPGPLETASLVVPLLAFAIRRANRAAIAMEARGLGAGPARTIVGAPRSGRAEAFFVVAAFAILAMLFIATSGVRRAW
ncbi:energy-coupling factor transporter transmembrane component T [Mesorhizobium sp. YIM 152430]|uniref:energy-coupling factor transporter transmembrane component T family protein n=1 Tax=Mesorhizobium sp. YIM 152430 TaxID=3031761 RepID=UPI0023DAA867|nr:energy-coupling factor transporter transmembrane component T [Mesorhizobium sp. YIM 152430]MDF1599610.1 energy-coupling factor transporter transmembrane component T [Mesorhizobium sp. YIM 152430]